MANEPITREEIMLNAVATGEAANLEPITREEMFLAKLGGADVRTPTPITRKEQFLQKAIEGGGGGGGSTGGSQLDAWIEGTLTEVSSNVESIGAYAFHGRSALTTANFPMATSIGHFAFQQCSALTTIYFPVATSVGSSSFNGCSALTTVCFPMVTSISTSAFPSCSALTTVDLPVVTSILNNAFGGCAKLSALILRTAEKVCTMGNTNVLVNTPIAKGTGYIYVPSALVDTYKAATNWSTYAAQFRALEDYTVDGTITGELDPSKI